MRGCTLYLLVRPCTWPHDTQNSRAAYLDFDASILLLWICDDTRISKGTLYALWPRMWHVLESRRQFIRLVYDDERIVMTREETETVILDFMIKLYGI